jgi:endonuclease/exonuclease/phosphatase family metal-dependent hydrolase
VKGRSSGNAVRRSRSFRVVTFNIWGFGEPWRYTMERAETRGAAPGSPATTLRPAGGIWPRRRRLLARCLADVRPDLIALQEVREDMAAGGLSQADQIARDLGFHCVFAPSEATDPFALDRGLGILSPHPIVRSAYLPLPPEPDAHIGRQTALHATIETPVGPIEFVAVHLTPRSEEARLAAVDVLLAYLGKLPPAATVVLVGDFNTEPESQAIRLVTGAREDSRPRIGLRDAWVCANPADPGATMPSHAPVSRLDYVFVGPGLRVIDARRIGTQPDPDGFFPSDHQGVAAIVAITAARNLAASVERHPVRAAACARDAFKGMLREEAHETDTAARADPPGDGTGNSTPREAPGHRLGGGGQAPSTLCPPIGG